MKIVAIGEVLWDAFPSGERLGGAPFNFSAHAARLGAEVAFVSGVGADERGDRVIAAMPGLMLSSRYVRRVPGTATGIVSVALNQEGEPTYTIHRPAAYDFPRLDSAALESLRAMKPDWIYYGTLAQTSEEVRNATLAAIGASPSAKRFYDINLRPGSSDPSLVRELLGAASFVKLNEPESRLVAGWTGLSPAPLELFTELFCEQFGLYGLCVTLGESGCAVRVGKEFARCPGYEVEVKDAVGAGDSFAAALLFGIANGWTAQETGAFANRVGALVASRSGAIPDWTVAEALSLPYNRMHEQY